MPLRKSILRAVLTCALLGAGPGLAQGLPGCTAATATDPDRTVFDCGNGLVFEAEATASLSAATDEDAIELDGQAIFVETDQLPEPVQIMTPHAIATVRGTTFVVDVEADRTSVFVANGLVEVSRRDGSQSVELSDGEGVDVEPGAPLTVKQWGEGRVDALLARFGR